MKWDLDERIEDAFRAYLESVQPGDMKAYAAWSFDTPQFPCSIAYVPTTAPVVEQAEWHDQRRFTAQIAVMIEAAPAKKDGVITKATRDRNALARGVVLEALAIGDLVDKLNATGVEGVLFSEAQVTTTERSVDGRVLITTITVEGIAEPQEAAGG